MEERAEFIQVNGAPGLRYLECFAFAKPVNVYSKRRDSTGAYLLRLGFDPRADRQRGAPLYIVRCKTGELLGEAEVIVRQKLGLPPRIVAA